VFISRPAETSLRIAFLRRTGRRTRLVTCAAGLWHLATAEGTTLGAATRISQDRTYVEFFSASRRLVVLSSQR
jgi:hypothetical protein